MGLLLIPVFAVVGFLGAFFVDTQRHDGKVARNVSLVGQELGGADEQAAQEAVAQLAARFSSIPVEVVAEDARIGTNAAALGLLLDSSKTLDSLLDVGQTESAFQRPISWAQRLFTPVDIPLTVDFDPTVAGLGLNEVASAFERRATYPAIEVRDGLIVGIEGDPGAALDTAALLAQLQDNVPTTADGAITLTAETINVPPVMSGDTLIAYTSQLNTLTDSPMLVTAGQVTKGIEPSTMRAWLQVEAPADPTSGPLTTIDEQAAQAHLLQLFADESTEVDLSTLTIVNKTPTLGDDSASICCSTDSPRRLLEAIIANQSEVTVPLVKGGVNPLASVGIIELIGEFTTYHPAGQDRNTNIDRMADIVRGTIVEPGDTFSINQYVGRRTEEKGFVPAGVIYNGVLTEDIGGGVSQFATTIFNAAFFAGLDFESYQAHSLYFERYPYGREATVSFPEPDLIIRNTTLTPIFIWTSHTSESITVEIYGSKYADVVESASWTEPIGECTKAITERTRLYPDKDAIVDTVFALYQPQEGLDCSGLPTTPPPECSPEEEPYDSNDTGFADDCRPLPEGEPPGDAFEELPGGGLGYACVGGQQPVDTDGDGFTDQCATPVTQAGDDPCAPQVGIDTDGNGFIDRCVNPEDA